MKHRKQQKENKLRKKQQKSFQQRDCMEIIIIQM